MRISDWNSDGCSSDLYAGLDRDSRVAQSREATSVGAWIGVLQGDDDARNPRRDQRVGAAWAARAGVGTGLERDIGGRTVRRRTRSRERHRLGKIGRAHV